MKKRKVLSLMLAAVMSMSLLTACGAPKVEDLPVSTEAAAEEAAPEEADLTTISAEEEFN